MHPDEHVLERGHVLEEADVLERPAEARLTMSFGRALRKMPNRTSDALVPRAAATTPMSIAIIRAMTVSAGSR